MSDVKRLIRKASQNLLLILLLIVANTYPLQAADPYADGRTDSMSFWFDPDTSSGENFLQYFERKQYRYVYKEATVLDSTNSTYFMIHGQNADPNYPDFYGGVQQLFDGRRVAIFSAWDLGKSNCEYFSCKADDAEVKNRITLYAKGARTTSQRSGGEGTFMQSFIYDFNWKVGQKISWLVSLEPAGADSLLSVAIKLEGQSWEFFASYLIPTRFKYGLAGGYGFIEDFGVNTPFIPRSMSIGPTIAETASGQWDVLTNVYIGSSKDKNRHKISVDGPSVLGQVGTEPQQDAKADYRVRLNSLSVIPDFSKGKAILDSVVQGRSTRYQEELKKLEDDAKAKAEIAAKAEAERITAEANAKAELEAKAKLEAIQRAEAEAKAKAEAEAKAAAELKAKQEAETKAKAVATKKKTTITCVKGKSKKKITAVNPKCPREYKKK